MRCASWTDPGLCLLLALRAVCSAHVRRVEVYAKPPRDEMGEEPAGGVVWYPHAAYSMDPRDAPDVFVAWRYAISATLGRHARQVYLYLQDIGEDISRQARQPPRCTHPPSWQSSLPAHMAASR